MTDLPVELQECIIVQFARDPDTTFEQLKTLRLVSRTFDVLCSRKFMSTIRLFHHGDDALANLRRLHGLIPSKKKSHCMDYPTTLIIENWRSVYGIKHFMSFREMRNSGQWVPGIILNSTFLPFLYFIAFLFMPQLIPVAVFNSVVRFKARHRLSHTRRLDMPNIRRVEWIADREDPNWTTSRTIKLLLEFPHLTELSLAVDEDQDIAYFAQCLSKLRKLKKLRLSVQRLGKPFRIQSPLIDEFGMVIGGNPMLTHLELFQSCASQASLSRMFEQVPPNCPLALEHLGISDNFRDTEAILPHISSFKMKSIYSWSSTILMLMLQERIFPPVIKTVRVDNQFMDYISSHPCITSLSVHSYYDDTVGTMVLETMARHCENLEYFSTFALSLCRCLKKVQNELSLFQCTNLRQLVLVHDRICLHLWTEANVTALEAGLAVISRMQRSLTLVITASDMMPFKACIKLCQESSNPLLRDLCGRIVYEKPVEGW